MEQNNSNSVISLVDLFAYCVRKFFVLLICALIGCAVLLAYHVGSNNTQKKKDAYDAAVANYKSSVVMTEQTLSNLRAKQKIIDDVLDNNPMFGDSEIYCARGVFSVDSQNGVMVTNNGDVVSLISSSISSVWNTIDLSQITGSDLSSDFLKTSVFYTSNGLMHQVDVYQDSEEKANEYRDKILDYLISFVEGQEGEKVTYKNIQTSIASKENINKLMSEYLEEKTEIVTKIDENEAILKNLKENPPSRYHLLRYAVLGFLAGGFVSVLFLAISFVSNNPLTSTFNTEKDLAVPFLGVYFSDKSVFARIARLIIGERRFKDTDKEEEYFREIISSKLVSKEGERRITVISSVDSRDVSVTGEKACKVLKECGYNASLLTDSVKNPKYAETLNNADAVILLEKQWVSKTQIVRMNIKNINDYEKTLLGFILC